MANYKVKIEKFREKDEEGNTSSYSTWVEIYTHVVEEIDMEGLLQAILDKTKTEKEVDAIH